MLGVMCSLALLMQLVSRERVLMCRCLLRWIALSLPFASSLVFTSSSQWGAPLLLLLLLLQQYCFGIIFAHRTTCLSGWRTKADHMQLYLSHSVSTTTFVRIHHIYIYTHTHTNIILSASCFVYNFSFKLLFFCFVLWGYHGSSMFCFVLFFFKSYINSTFAKFSMSLMHSGSSWLIDWLIIALCSGHISFKAIKFMFAATSR